MSEDFTSDNKILERLTTLETKFDIYIKETRDNNEKLNHIIIGNGSKGLAEKVRNLEESEKERKGYFKAFNFAVLGLICERVWSFITRGN